MSERTWYSTRQVADLLGYHVVTVRRRIYDSTIPAYQLADKGPWRIPSWWVEQEMDKRRQPVKRPKRRMVTLDSRQEERGGTSEHLR